MNIVQAKHGQRSEDYNADFPHSLSRFDDWVKRQPDQTLYTFLNRHGETVYQYTYREFSDRISVIASNLIENQALVPGARLLLLYQPGLEMIAALFACARAGLIGVPCAPLSSHGFGTAISRLDHVISDCAATAVLMDGRTREIIDQNNSATEEAGYDLLINRLELIVTEELTEPTTAIVVAPPNPVLFLQYTSGSTNQPKGVMVSHQNILHNCDLVVDHEKPVTVTWLPQHHDMGLIGYYIYTALTGGTTYACAPAAFMQRPLLWLETISKYKATASSAPNFAYELCLHEKRVPEEALERLDLASLKFLMAAAEPINSGTFERFRQRFRKCGLRNDAMSVAYGLAEFTLAVSHYGKDFLTLNKRHLAAGLVKPVEEVSEVSEQMKLMSCGRPLGDTQIAIVDPDSFAEMPENAVGEIWLAGASKCLGYWGRPELSEACFNAMIAGRPDEGDGYLRTGDMGFMHDGELYVCGRRKDMIIVRGQNYYPQDIERLVEERFSALRKGCVAAFEIETREGPGVALVAEVTPRSEIPDASDVVRVIGEHMKLRVEQVAFVAPRSVAKTSSGKIRRYKTRELLLNDKLKVVGGREFDAESVFNGEETLNELLLLKQRYNLTGEEDYTLLDAGIDSLDTITLLHWLKEIVSENADNALADSIDIKVLGAVTIRQIFHMAELLENGHDDATQELRALLLDQFQEHLSEERRLMMADRFLSFEPEMPEAVPDTSEEFGPARHVLLTGTTGFLGPFLLDSLLQQTRANVTVLVRGKNLEHAKERLRHAVSSSGVAETALTLLEERVEVICGDLEKERLGIDVGRWAELAESVDTIYHNGALVNYLLDYRRMRAANVDGTNEILKLAFAGKPKQFNFISSTFIYGWAVKEFLYETDCNAEGEKLDFGYSQSKWVSEQLIHDAARKGLATRIFRPSLITPALDGSGENMDITIRLLAFMIKYGIGLSTRNQVSFMPADMTANNIVALCNNPDTLGGAFHVVRDDYENMTDITDRITARTGRPFHHYSLEEAVPEIIRRCTREDLLYPLLDFLIGSVDNISNMEFKLYESSAYKAARRETDLCWPDPPLDDVVDGILAFMEKNHIVEGLSVQAAAE